ncbi:MAG: LPS export ABC transporter periplasmic protein LptC [Pseudomonadota bacterium]
MNRIGLSIALLFSAVFGLYLVILFSADKLEQAVIDDQSIKPTYRAINLNSKLYDDNGRLSHQVEAQSMEHYQPLGFMVFENPLYTVYLEESEPWQVTAEEGTLYENNRIQLERNVKIVNMNRFDYVKQISTDYIEINLDDKTLKSDSRVVISGDAFNVQSIGITGNLTTQQYKLTQNVQSTFSN